MPPQENEHPSDAEVSASGPGASPRRIWKKVAIAIVGSVVVLVVVLQVLVSPIALAVVNQRLAAMPGYTAQVDSIKIAPLRGTVRAKKFVLHERGYEDDLPVVRVDRLTVRLAWTALLRGRLRGELVAEGVETSVVKRSEASKAEDGKEDNKNPVEEAGQKARPWREALGKTLPIEISRFQVKNGRARFVDRTQSVPVRVAIENLEINLEGLLTRRTAERYPAKLELTGVSTGGGQLKILVQAAPMERAPRFAATMELNNQSLPPLNSLLLAYANADVSQGTFEFFLEVTAENGRYEGYTKPFLKDVEFSTPSDDDKSLVQKIAKGAVNAAVKLLENDEDEKVATKAPFSGTLEATDVDVWAAVINLLRNAFIQALSEGFERGR